jgi:2-keto-4-pentenoate hydratase/2-oxohepta-3-ene-1,7-dioic acid hydratase in catechol pathway
MKLVTYTFRGTTRLGALLHRDGGEGGFDDATVVDLNRACALHRADRGERRARALADFLVPPDMRAFLEAGDPAMDAARSALAHAAERIAAHRDDAMAAGLAFGTDEPGFRLEAPVPRPGKVLAVGVNYRDHSAETGIPVPERPIIFAKNASCVVGPGTPIEKPRFSPFLDWEGELCFVVGRWARHVPADRALEYLAGYMVGHDVSVRDWQVHSQTMMRGKSFDSHGPTGPWLVTRDEIPDPGTLGLKTFVNGVVKQDSNTDQLIFGVSALVEYLSRAFTLEPGDVVFTGTPAGVGVARKPKEFLKAGDVVRIEIAGLGALENPVVDEPER